MRDAVLILNHSVAYIIAFKIKKSAYQGAPRYTGTDQVTNWIQFACRYSSIDI